MHFSQSVIVGLWALTTAHALPQRGRGGETAQQAAAKIPQVSSILLPKLEADHG